MDALQVMVACVLLASGCCAADKGSSPRSAPSPLRFVVDDMASSWNEMLNQYRDKHLSQDLLFPADLVFVMNRHSEDAVVNSLKDDEHREYREEDPGPEEADGKEVLMFLEKELEMIDPEAADNQIAADSGDASEGVVLVMKQGEDDATPGPTCPSVEPQPADAADRIIALLKSLESAASDATRTTSTPTTLPPPAQQDIGDVLSFLRSLGLVEPRRTKRHPRDVRLIEPTGELDPMNTFVDEEAVNPMGVVDLGGLRTDDEVLDSIAHRLLQVDTPPPPVDIDSPAESNGQGLIPEWQDPPQPAIPDEVANTAPVKQNGLRSADSAFYGDSQWLVDSLPPPPVEEVNESPIVRGPTAQGWSAENAPIAFPDKDPVSSGGQLEQFAPVSAGGQQQFAPVSFVGRQQFAPVSSGGQQQFGAPGDLRPVEGWASKYPPPAAVDPDQSDPLEEDQFAARILPQWSEPQASNAPFNEAVESVETPSQQLPKINFAFKFSPQWSTPDSPPASFNDDILDPEISSQSRTPLDTVDSDGLPPSAAEHRDSPVVLPNFQDDVVGPDIPQPPVEVPQDVISTTAPGWVSRTVLEPPTNAPQPKGAPTQDDIKPTTPGWVIETPASPTIEVVKMVPVLPGHGPTAPANKLGGNGRHDEVRKKSENTPPERVVVSHGVDVSLRHAADASQEKKQSESTIEKQITNEKKPSHMEEKNNEEKLRHESHAHPEKSPPIVEAGSKSDFHEIMKNEEKKLAAGKTAAGHHRHEKGAEDVSLVESNNKPVPVVPPLQEKPMDAVVDKPVTFTLPVPVDAPEVRNLLDIKLAFEDDPHADRADKVPTGSSPENKSVVPTETIQKDLKNANPTTKLNRVSEKTVSTTTKLTKVSEKTDDTSDSQKSTDDVSSVSPRTGTLQDSVKHLQPSEDPQHEHLSLQSVVRSARGEKTDGEEDQNDFVHPTDSEDQSQDPSPEACDETMTFPSDDEVLTPTPSAEWDSYSGEVHQIPDSSFTSASPSNPSDEPTVADNTPDEGQLDNAERNSFCGFAHLVPTMASDSVNGHGHQESWIPSRPTENPESPHDAYSFTGEPTDFQQDAATTESAPKKKKKKKKGFRLPFMVTTTTKAPWPKSLANLAPFLPIPPEDTQILPPARYTRQRLFNAPDNHHHHHATTSSEHAVNNNHGYSYNHHHHPHHAADVEVATLPPLQYVDPLQQRYQVGPPSFESSDYAAQYPGMYQPDYQVPYQSSHQPENYQNSYQNSYPHHGYQQQNGFHQAETNYQPSMYQQTMYAAQDHPMMYAEQPMEQAGYQQPNYQDQSVYQQSMYQGQPDYQQPMYEGQSSYQQPMFQGQSSYQQPMYQGQSSYQQPMYQGQSSYQQPRYPESGYQQPMHQNPVFQQPMYQPNEMSWGGRRRRRSIGDKKDTSGKLTDSEKSLPLDRKPELAQSEVISEVQDIEEKGATDTITGSPKEPVKFSLMPQELTEVKKSPAPSGTLDLSVAAAGKHVATEEKKGGIIAPANEEAGLEDKALPSTKSIVLSDENILPKSQADPLITEKMTPLLDVSKSEEPSVLTTAAELHDPQDIVLPSSSLTTREGDLPAAETTLLLGDLPAIKPLSFDDNSAVPSSQDIQDIDIPASLASDDLPAEPLLPVFPLSSDGDILPPGLPAPQDAQEALLAPSAVAAVPTSEDAFPPDSVVLASSALDDAGLVDDPLLTMAAMVPPRPPPPRPLHHHAQVHPDAEGPEGPQLARRARQHRQHDAAPAAESQGHHYHHPHAHGPPAIPPAVEDLIPKTGETEVERAEREQKAVQRMIQVVNVLGSLQNFLSDRARTLVRRLSKIVEEEEEQKLV